MISQTAEYALRAVVYLAINEGKAFTTQQIGEATKVPVPYLSKVLQALAKAGIVRSQRGLGGGFTLAEPAAQLTTLSVINAVDPVRRIKTCPLGLEEHSGALCSLHRKLDEAIAAFELAFSSATIATIIADDTAPIPLAARVINRADLSSRGEWHG